MRLGILNVKDFFDIAGSDIPLDENKSAYSAGCKIADDFIVVGIYTVPAGVKIGLGHPRDPHTRYGGVIYARLDCTTGGQIVGKFRIHFADPTFDNLIMMKEWRTNSQDNTTPTDKSKNPTAVPESPFVKQESKIVLSIKPDDPTGDEDIDVSDADNLIVISITEMPYDAEKE